MSRGKPRAGDGDVPKDEIKLIDLIDKDLQAACNAPPFAGIQPSQLAKSGWTTTPNYAYIMIAHYPKVFRTPARRFPRCLVRTTWVFREGSWSRIEDSVNIRSLEVRSAKFDERPIMSVTVFGRPPDDPDVVPDSDLDESFGPDSRSQSRDERLKIEAKSRLHLFCHRPKNPFCPVCQRAKMMAPCARKTGGSSTIRSEAYGDHITIDLIIAKDLRDCGFDDQKVSLIVKDVYTNFRHVYPSAKKDCEQVLDDLLRFTGVDDNIKVVYSDNAPELIYGVKQLDKSIRHVASREYAAQSVAEREVRIVLDGARSNLVQSGFPEKFWPLAAQHHTMALNLTKRADVDAVPWELTFGSMFDGMIVPFAAKVLYWNDPKRKSKGPSKFGPSSAESVFLGYHIQPGFVWKGDYLVTPLEELRNAIEIGTLPLLRVSRMEVPVGGHSFPVHDLTSNKIDPARPPKLDDRNCHAVQDNIQKGIDGGKLVEKSSEAQGQGGVQGLRFHTSMIHQNAGRFSRPCRLYS